MGITMALARDKEVPPTQLPPLTMDPEVPPMDGAAMDGSNVGDLQAAGGVHDEQVVEDGVQDGELVDDVPDVVGHGNDFEADWDGGGDEDVEYNDDCMGR
eukprot:jgi/Mesvir1/16156/Mv08426-RA.1